MKKTIDALMMSPLLKGITSEDASEIAKCFEIKTVDFHKGSFIFMEGESPTGVGVVVEGKIHIIKDDFLGNRDILAEVNKGEIFDEVYAVLNMKNMGISAVACEKSKVAFLSIEKIMTVCSKGCAFHNTIIKNMVRVLAQKNLLLSRKIEHLSKRTIREKLISYFSEQVMKNGSMEFTVPFNRQEMADYLSVERSALSRELSKMRKEGQLEFYKNRFVLYNG